jgi:hypothetical protein
MAAPALMLANAMTTLAAAARAMREFQGTHDGRRMALEIVEEAFREQSQEA